MGDFWCALVNTRRRGALRNVVSELGRVGATAGLAPGGARWGRVELLIEARPDLDCVCQRFAVARHGMGWQRFLGMSRCAV